MIHDPLTRGDVPVNICISQGEPGCEKDNDKKNTYQYREHGFQFGNEATAGAFDGMVQLTKSGSRSKWVLVQATQPAKAHIENRK